MEKGSDWKEALHLFEIRQYERAMPVFRKYARENDPEAEYYLGLMYANGLAVKPNEKEAFQLFTKAATERYVEAVRKLGECYEKGIFVPADLAKAFEYYSAAYHDGDAEAGLRIASFYEEGIYLEKSPQKALEVYVELAKKEHPFAMYKIGMAYLQGQGIRKSAENAHLWLNKALQKGSVDAMNTFRLLGTPSQNDSRSAKQILSIGNDLLHQGKQTEAIPYLRIADREGSLEATMILARLYRSDRTTDTQTAIGYLAKAAKQGVPEAMLTLGRIYEQGEGVPSSFLTAAKWYKLAADAGDLQAKAEYRGIRGDLDA